MKSYLLFKINLAKIFKRIIEVGQENRSIVDEMGKSGFRRSWPQVELRSCHLLRRPGSHSSGGDRDGIPGAGSSCGASAGEDTGGGSGTNPAALP